jgi:hypothetical protein
MGDVISMSIESVVISIRGSEQTFERNKIKKIFLVERTVTHISVPETPAIGATAPNSSETPHQ